MIIQAWRLTWPEYLVKKSNYYFETMKYLLQVTILLSACQSQQQILDTWMGHHKSALIMSWGPPQRTASDGNNGEILVYAKQISTGGSSFYSDNGSATTSQRRMYWKYTMFYADSEGKIYYWRTSTEYIPPTQIDLTVYHYKRY